MRFNHDRGDLNKRDRELRKREREIKKKKKTLDISIHLLYSIPVLISYENFFERF